MHSIELNSPVFHEYLEHGEKLLWTGKPQGGIVFRLIDIYLIPFSLLWCGVTGVWMVMAVRTSPFLALFGIPFVGIGLILLFGRFIIDARQREHTCYALTSERIIIKSGIKRTAIQSINLNNLTDLEFRETKNGMGTISFGPKNPFMIGDMGMNWWPGMKLAPSFSMISDAGSVYRKILELQRNKQHV